MASTLPSFASAAPSRYYRVELHLKGRTYPLFDSDATNVQGTLKGLRAWAAKDYPGNPEKGVKVWEITNGAFGKITVRRLTAKEITKAL